MVSDMQRREFITLLGGAAAAWPLAARAQPKAMPVVGFINSASPGPYPPVSAFLKGLNESGFGVGRNVTIEYRWAEGHYERLPALIADLVQHKVNVIAATSTPAAFAAKAANTTIPIVFTTSGDPVKLGFVSSLSKPDRNFTGATQINVEVAPKRLELMHEAIPTANNIALLINSPDPLAAPVSRETSAAAAALGINLHILHATSAQGFAAVFDSLVQQRAGALVIGSDPLFSSHSKELAEMALRYRVPAIYQYPEFAEAGGLMSYGGDVAESYRVAGVYVGRLLKGAKPSDLPVQEVTKVELIVNLKTAKVLGLTVPPQIVARADKVIE
jgi:putative tryptophan/tyrosine transport system substrate-binding protein